MLWYFSVFSFQFPSLFCSLLLSPKFVRTCSFFCPYFHSRKFTSLFFFKLYCEKKIPFLCASGQIPPELGNLVNLARLDLDNKMHFIYIVKPWCCAYNWACVTWCAPKYNKLIEPLWFYLFCSKVYLFQYQNKHTWNFNVTGEDSVCL